MADLFAVVFDPNNIKEIRTSKTEEGGGGGGGGGAKSLSFKEGGEIPRDLAPGRVKSLGISPGGEQIPGGKGGGEIPATPEHLFQSRQSITASLVWLFALSLHSLVHSQFATYELRVENLRVAGL